MSEFVASMQVVKAKIDAATRPDRELDALIAALCLGIHHVVSSVSERGTSKSIGAAIPRYTRSLDATVALIDRDLPGFYWEVAKGQEYSDARGPYWGYVYDESLLNIDGAPDPHHGKGPALALLNAYFAARIQKSCRSESKA